MDSPWRRNSQHYQYPQGTFSFLGCISGSCITSNVGLLACSALYWNHHKNSHLHAESSSPSEISNKANIRQPILQHQAKSYLQILWMMLLSRKKLKPKLPLALSWPQWKRGKRFICLFSHPLEQICFLLLTWHWSLMKKLTITLSSWGWYLPYSSHSQGFKKTCIWYYTAAGVNLLMPRSLTR